MLQKSALVEHSENNPAAAKGDLQSIAGTETSPQAHIMLVNDPERDGIRRTRIPSAATYDFAVRTPGFYRMRMWSYWQPGIQPAMSLTLDGSTLGTPFGRGDMTFQKWHWVILPEVLALGAGNHRLSVRDWKLGAMIGTFEIFPAW